MITDSSCVTMVNVLMKISVVTTRTTVETTVMNIHVIRNLGNVRSKVMANKLMTLCKLNTIQLIVVVCRISPCT